MKSGFRTTLHLLVIISLLLASLFVAVTPSGASPEQQSLSAAPYAADSVLVKFKPGTPAAEKANAHAAVQGQVVTEYSLVPGLQQLRLPVDKIGVEKAVEILSHRPSVEYAEPDYIVQATLEPNDLDNYYLWGMDNIRAPEAWGTCTDCTGDPDFVVAVIDTGIDYNHPDLQGNMWYEGGVYGWDWANGDNDPMDDSGHGTHVAGTIGARGNNSIGVVGVNWNVKLMALKFLGPNGGYTSDAISALQYAIANGAKVSNNSWGSSGYSTTLYDAIKIAGEAHGHLFVAAAGNNGWDIDGKNISRRFYPAGYDLPNIISVAAIDSGDAKASWSNYGAKSVDLGAPGVGIWSTVWNTNTDPNTKYASYSGTSMASPHVAGAAALLWGRNSGWSYSDVKARILNTARKIDALKGRTVTGGTLDLAAAVGPPPTAEPPVAPTNLVATPASSSQIDLSWTDNSDNETGFKVERSLDGSQWGGPVSLSANTTTYLDTGLTASTKYYYRVYAYNSASSSGYATADATTHSDSATPPPPSDNTVHIGDLDGSSAAQGPNKWKATVTILVHDGSGQPFSGATVSGTWSNGATGGSSCTTGSTGTCSVTKTNINNFETSVTFTIDNVTASGYEYSGAGDVESFIIVNSPGTASKR